MQRDWRVVCYVCGADYTPKADDRPGGCYMCGSMHIYATEIEP